MRPEAGPGAKEIGATQLLPTFLLMSPYGGEEKVHGCIVLPQEKAKANNLIGRLLLATATPLQMCHEGVELERTLAAHTTLWWRPFSQAQSTAAREEEIWRWQRRARESALWQLATVHSATAQDTSAQSRLAHSKFMCHNGDAACLASR